MESYVKVVGYRDYLNDKGETASKQVYFEEPYNFKSHQDLFSNLDAFLTTNIPRAERYNLHYTLNHIPAGAAQKNEVAYIEVIPLDIDHAFTERADEYIQIVEEVFRMQRDSFVSLVTGNGLQCLFLLDTKLEESKWLALRTSYRLKCDQIEELIEERGLKKVVSEGKFTSCDVEVLRVGTMRLPSTLNIKKDKGSTRAELLTGHLEAASLEQLGLYFEHIPTKKTTVPREYLSVASEYVMSNCQALSTFKEKKGNVSYPHWRNAASIVSRFTDVDGPELFHKLSSGHSNYSKGETQNLIDYTLGSGGPVGCAKFSESFKGCLNCKYYKSKLKSPINLRNKAFFPNEHTGFHQQVEAGKGFKWQPVFKEMVGKFMKEYEHVSLQTSEEIYTFAEGKNTWAPMPQRKMLGMLKEYTSTKPGDYPRTAIYTEAVSHAVLENIIEDEIFFDASKGKVNFLNGHVEIREDKIVFLKNSVDSLTHRFLFALPYEYQPEAQCPNFKKFVDEICNGDELLVLSLVEYVGYVISNDEYWKAIFMVLEGEGANGKSVLLEIIRKLCGEGNYASLKVTDLSNEQQRFNLIGKMANICDESEKGTLTKSADLKNLTDGGIFTYKQVYAKPGEAKNRAKFIFSTNHGFTTTDFSGGMKRRYFPIPLDQVFVEEGKELGPNERLADPFMADKLSDELPGIWNYCIEKYLEAKKRKHFTISKATEDKLEDFEESSNPLKMYIESFIQTKKGDEIYSSIDYVTAKSKVAKKMDEVKDTEYLEYTYIPLNELRKNYNLWLKDQGYIGEHGPRSFNKMLASEAKGLAPTNSVFNVVLSRRTISGVKAKAFLCKWKPFI